MNYYYIVLYYRPFGMSAHIIRAKSKKGALKIRKVHGISYPMNVPNTRIRMKKIKCKKLDISDEIDMSLIKRRRLEHGGCIWYDDENGRLRIETVK